MWTSQFWIAVTERAIKTWCQTLVALLAGDGIGLLDVDWPHVASVAALAAVVSILTSIASGALTGTGPSLSRAEVVAAKTVNDATLASIYDKGNDDTAAI